MSAIENSIKSEKIPLTCFKFIADAYLMKVCRLKSCKNTSTKNALAFEKFKLSVKVSCHLETTVRLCHHVNSVITYNKCWSILEPTTTLSSKTDMGSGFAVFILL